MDVKAFIEFKVILKDSDPASPEGKAALKEQLVSFLGISESRVEELMNSLPVTLKSGLSENEAKAFAKVLRELGALVFVEKISNEAEQEEAKQSASFWKKHQGQTKQPKYFILLLGIAILAILFLSLQKPTSQPGITIDADSLVKMLESQKSILAANQKKETKEKKLVEIHFTGKSYQRPVALTAELTEEDGKIKNALVKFATESPGELTPEQIIRGVQLPWLQEGEVLFDRRTAKKKSKKLLRSDAKLYILRGESNERLVAEAIIQALPATNEQERRYLFKLKYKPKSQFKSDPFFIEYKSESGYSIVLNQEITMVQKISDEKSPINKLTENQAPTKNE